MKRTALMSLARKGNGQDLENVTRALLTKGANVNKRSLVSAWRDGLIYFISCSRLTVDHFAVLAFSFGGITPVTPSCACARPSEALS